jgi:hypothetical protein
MFEQMLQRGDHLQLLDIRTFPAGLYFLTVQSGNEKISQAFIKR